MMEQLLSTFSSVLSNPEYYLDPTEHVRQACLQGTKQAYTQCKASCSATGVSSGPLAELYTEGFDVEQIWEQLQLLNVSLLSDVSNEVDEVSQVLDLALLPPPSGDEYQRGVDDNQGIEGTEGSEGSDHDSEHDSEHDSGKDLATENSTATVPSRKPNFFDLNAMEKFLDEAETKPLQDGEELDEDEDEDEDFEDREKADARYDDFFDPPVGQPGTREERDMEHEEEEEGNEEEEGDEEELERGEDEVEEVERDEEDEEEVERDEDEEDELGEEEVDKIADTVEAEKELSIVKEKLSTFEKSQKKLQKQIAVMETCNLSDKPWQMVGEVTDHTRPVNSLLEEDLDFEQMSRPQPVITEEKTRSLEDVIKQRVIDEAWDDVERKVKPKERPYNYSLRRPLDQEKSKLSLAEVYEKEYVEKTQESKEEKIDERHKEISEVMKSLFVKLDALSNFFFTPKPVKPEVKIVANVPAVVLEEVAPVTMSDAKLLAPEEIQPKSRHEEVGDTEKTAVDRRRERRLKKKQKRLKVAQNLAAEKIVTKLKPGLGNKYSKQLVKNRLLSEDKERGFEQSLKSSSNFFAQLQDTVRTEVKTKAASHGQNPVVNPALSTSYKL